MEQSDQRGRSVRDDVWRGQALSAGLSRNALDPANSAGRQA